MLIGCIPSILNWYLLLLAGLQALLGKRILMLAMLQRGDLL